MKPEDIRRLYRGETPATDAEQAETRERLRTDPDEARRLLLSLYALGGEDKEIAALVDLVVKVGAMQLIAQRAHDDDQFALQMGELIVDAMERMKPGSMKTPRGKPKTARSA